MADAPLTAPAAEKPCALHRYHHPRVVRTRGHHRHPIYLQRRVYGEVRDHDVAFLCGTDHDSVHAWLSYLLGEARCPNPEPGRLAKAEAQRSYDWYVGAKV